MAAALEEAAVTSRNERRVWHSVQRAQSSGVKHSAGRAVSQKVHQKCNPSCSSSPRLKSLTISMMYLVLEDAIRGYANGKALAHGVMTSFRAASAVLFFFRTARLFAIISAAVRRGSRSIVARYFCALASIARQCAGVQLYCE